MPNMSGTSHSAGGGPSTTGGVDLSADVVSVGAHLLMEPGSTAGFGGITQPENTIDVDGMIKLRNQSVFEYSKDLALYCTNGNQLFWQDQHIVSGGGGGGGVHATDITITDDDTKGTYYVPFVTGKGDKKDLFIQDGSVDGVKSSLKYVIGTSGEEGKLVTDKFEGALVGNADTATSADTVKTIKDDGTGSGGNSDHYVTFVDDNNSSATAEAVFTNTNLKYNPNTKTLTTDNFVGDMTGTADDAKKVETIEDDGSGTGGDSDHFVTFVDDNNSAATAEAVFTNGSLKYNPNTKTLTTDNFVGSLDGKVKTKMAATTLNKKYYPILGDAGATSATTKLSNELTNLDNTDGVVIYQAKAGYNGPVTSSNYFKGVIQEENVVIATGGIEKYGGSNTVAKITTATDHYLIGGAGVRVANISIAAYNGLFTVTAVLDATSFTYTHESDTGAPSLLTNPHIRRAPVFGDVAGDVRGDVTGNVEGTATKSSTSAVTNLTTNGVDYAIPMGTLSGGTAAARDTITLGYDGDASGNALLKYNPSVRYLGNLDTIYINSTTIGTTTANRLQQNSGTLYFNGNALQTAGGGQTFTKVTIVANAATSYFPIEYTGLYNYSAFFLRKSNADNAYALIGERWQMTKNDTSTGTSATKDFYPLWADANYIHLGIGLNTSDTLISLPFDTANFGGRAYFGKGIQTPDTTGFVGKTYVNGGMAGSRAYYLMAMDTGVPTFNKFFGVTSGYAQLWASHASYTGPLLYMSNMEALSVTKSGGYEGKVTQLNFANTGGTGLAYYETFVANPAVSGGLTDIISIEYQDDNIDVYITLPDPSTCVGRSVNFFVTAEPQVYPVNMNTNQLYIRASSASSGKWLYQDHQLRVESPSYYKMSSWYSFTITAISTTKWYFRYGVVQTYNP